FFSILRRPVRHTVPMVLSPGLELEESNAREVNRPDQPAAASPEPRDFPTVYETHFDFVWRSLRRLGVPESALDDAHQEVFLVAYRRLGGFRGHSKLKTWLFGIVLNVVRHQRRASRLLKSHDRISETELAAPQPGPLESAAKAEAAAMLQAF